MLTLSRLPYFDMEDLLITVSCIAVILVFCSIVIMWIACITLIIFRIHFIILIFIIARTMTIDMIILCTSTSVFTSLFYLFLLSSSICNIQHCKALSLYRLHEYCGILPLESGQITHKNLHLVYFCHWDAAGTKEALYLQAVKWNLASWPVGCFSVGGRCGIALRRFHFFLGRSIALSACIWVDFIISCGY